MVRSFANFFVRPTVLARFAFADPATTTQAPPLGHASVLHKDRICCKTFKMVLTTHIFAVRLIHKRFLIAHSKMKRKCHT